MVHGLRGGMACEGIIAGSKQRNEAKRVRQDSEGRAQVQRYRGATGTVRPDAAWNLEGRKCTAMCIMTMLSYRCLPGDNVAGSYECLLYGGVRDRYVEGVPSGIAEAATAYSKETH